MLRTPRIIKMNPLVSPLLFLGAGPGVRAVFPEAWVHIWGRVRATLICGTLALALPSTFCCFAADTPPAAASATTPGNASAGTPGPAGGAALSFPPGFVRESVSLRYVSYEDVDALVDESLQHLESLDLVGPSSHGPQPDPPSHPTGNLDVPPPDKPAHPATLMSVLPEGSQLVPDTASNSIFVTSTPDGVRLAKLLIDGIDVRRPFITVRVVTLIIKEDATSPWGVHPPSAPPPLILATPRLEGTPADSVAITSVTGNEQAALTSIQNTSIARVVSTQRMAFQDGVPGRMYFTGIEHPGMIITSEKMAPGRHIPILTQMNSDGTITLHARIEGPWASDGSYQGSITIPGIRIVNGESILVERVPATTTASSRDQPQPKIIPSTPAKTHPLFLITVNLVDVHGQPIPGGRDAVKKALAQP